MRAKTWIFIIALTILFSQSFLWSAKYKMQTLLEKGFDTEIEDVVFVSHEEDDTLKFYPKVVILKHLDRDLSQGDYKFYKKEVQILNSDGNVLRDLWFPYWSLIGCSENGNYFYVWTIIREKPDPYDPSKIYDTKIKESSFAVYSNKGEMLWKKSPYEPIYDVSYTFLISPKDGSVIERLSTFYDPQGQAKPIRPLCSYNDYELYGFSENWDYVVVLAYKYPEAHWQSIPGKSPEPRVLLVDSLLNLVWERPLDEYNGYGAAISSKGSYIYASGYTTMHQKTALLQGGIVSSTGYLYDRKGDLITKIEHGSYPKTFSSNERYLLINFYTPSEKLINEIGLFDIKARKMLFKKGFRIRGGMVASDGSVAILRKIKPEADHKQLEKISVSEGRKLVMQLEEQAKWKFYIFDKSGETLLESEGFESKGKKIVYQILNWDEEELTLSVIDKIQNKVKILFLGLEHKQ